jgi:hypothetical protein
MLDLERFIPSAAKISSNDFGTLDENGMKELQEKEELKMNKEIVEDTSLREEEFDLHWTKWKKQVKVVSREGHDSIELQALQVCVPISKEIGNLYQIVTTSTKNKQKLVAVSPPKKVSLSPEFPFSKMTKDFFDFIHNYHVDCHGYCHLLEFPTDTVEEYFDTFLRYAMGSLRQNEDTNRYKSKFDIKRVMKEGLLLKREDTLIDPDDYKTLEQMALEDMLGRGNDMPYKPSTPISPQDFIQKLRGLILPLLEEKNED